MAFGVLLKSRNSSGEHHEIFDTRDPDNYFQQPAVMYVLQGGLQGSIYLPTILSAGKPEDCSYSLFPHTDTEDLPTTSISDDTLYWDYTNGTEDDRTTVVVWA